MVVPNLLIIAGTGNKSGKTTLACRIIGQFRDLNVISVKITPHFHETTPGLILLKEGNGCSIYEETDPEGTKDTCRMLNAGAKRVFFAKVTDRTLFEAFKQILELIPPGTPVICESPALRYYVEPGVFAIMISNEQNNQKNISNLFALPHVKLSLGLLSEKEDLQIDFSNGKWISLQ